MASEREKMLVASTTLTLTLSILGSSILPIPYCFARAGIIPGLILAVLVAYANALTARLLIDAAHRLNHDSYDALATAIAGRAGRIVAQCSLVLLLFGSFTGSCTLLADVGSMALKRLVVDQQDPWLVWLTAQGGRGIMLVLVCSICLPLSLLQHIRMLDRAAAMGLIPLAVLVVTMAVDTIAAGFPALKSGEFPLIRISSDLTEAAAILGYAFYMQPMLLPLLHDLPHEDGEGARVLIKSVRISVMAIAMSVYTTVGMLGASRYGTATQGDVLLNEWLPGRWGGVLSLAMAAYLAVSAVPVQISLRYTLEDMVAGTEDPPSDFSLARHILCTCVPMVGSVAIAASYPSYAEKIFAATGALPVCLICYVIPVWLHLVLYWRRKGAAEDDDVRVGLLEGGDDAHGGEDSVLRDVVVPVCVAVGMTCISAVAFWRSIKAFWGGGGEHLLGMVM